MNISVTEFRRRCHEIVRLVERSGRSVTITRDGKLVARLRPLSPTTRERRRKPWEELRALGGRLLAKPNHSVLRDEDFEAMR